MQWNEDGTERPISFASSKLTGSQLSWTTLKKRRMPLFGLSTNSVRGTNTNNYKYVISTAPHRPTPIVTSGSLATVVSTAISFIYGGDLRGRCACCTSVSSVWLSGYTSPFKRLRLISLSCVCVVFLLCRCMSRKCGYIIYFI